MKDFKPLEQQLFDWDGGWDGDHEYMQFCDCTLKVGVGRHPKGTKVPTIVIMFDKSVMQLYFGDTQAYEDYELLIRVGGMVTDGN